MKKTDGTVYAKLLMMAKEEAEGRQTVNIKELCNHISKRFRLSNKEILLALKEANRRSKFAKVNRFSFTFDF